MRAEIKYILNVLGVNSFISPKGNEEDNLISFEPKTQTVKPSHLIQKVVFLFDESLTAEEQELFDKMTGAMGLRKLDFTLLTAAMLNEVIPYLDAENIIINMMDERGIAYKVPGKLIKTYGPRVLIKSPHLKRKAWDDLKNAMQMISE